MALKGEVRFPLLVTLGLTCFGLYGLILGVSELRHGLWLASFEPIEATVTATRIDEVSSTAMEGLAPRVIFRFTVDNKHFTGHMIRWHAALPGFAPPEAGSGPPPQDIVIWGRSDSARARLDNLLARYSVGSKVTAYYDPHDPTTCSLTYFPFDPNLWVGVGFPIAFVLVAWAIFGMVCLVIKSHAAVRAAPQDQAAPSPERPRPNRHLK